MGRALMEGWKGGRAVTCGMGWGLVANGWEGDPTSKTQRREEKEEEEEEKEKEIEKGQEVFQLFQVQLPDQNIRGPASEGSASTPAPTPVEVSYINGLETNVCTHVDIIKSAFVASPSAVLGILKPSFVSRNWPQELSVSG